MRFVAGRGAVTERHREDVAGRGAAAKSYREDVAGRGAVAELLTKALRQSCWPGRRSGRDTTGRGAAAELLPAAAGRHYNKKESDP